MDNIYDPYKELANAIIVTAALDYRAIKRAGNTNSHRFKKLLDFFNNCCNGLCSYDMAQAIMNRLDKERGNEETIRYYRR